MMLDGPSTLIAAFRDPLVAQSHLEMTIDASRNGGSEQERKALYARVKAQGDGEPKQLPHDMMLYLVEHLDDFTIAL